MLVKVCPTCGKRFEADDDELVYCSSGCFKKMNKKRRGLSETEKLEGVKRVQKEATRAAAERRRSYLARRDAEYAKLGTRVTVEVRDLRDSELGCIMRVENRGNVPIGFGAAAHVSHN